MFRYVGVTASALDASTHCGIFKDITDRIACHAGPESGDEQEDAASILTLAHMRC